MMGWTGAFRSGRTKFLYDFCLVLGAVAFNVFEYHTRDVHNNIIRYKGFDPHFTQRRPYASLLCAGC